MKQLNEQQLQTHVPIVGWLLIAHSLLQMVMGVVAFAYMMSASWFWTQLGQFEPATHDPEAARIFALINAPIVFTAVVTGVLVVGLALPALIAGIGLLARKSWARVLGVIVSAFRLFAIPVGTLIGIYAIFVLMQDAATRYFSSPPARMQAMPQAV